MGRNPRHSISNKPFTMPIPTDPSDRPHAIAAALFRSLRDGSAGFVTRLGLSLAAAGAAAGFLMVILGVAEDASRRIRDEHVAIGFLVVLLAWAGLLYPIWSTYSRKRHIVRTVIACFAIVALAVCTATVFGVSMRTPEFFIAGTLFLGAAALAVVITAAIHQGSRGRAITVGGVGGAGGEGGAVSVHCPRCGYSMSGLDTSTCPECGARYTLDELIRAQDYDSLRPTRNPLPAPPLHPPNAQPALPSTTGI